MASESDVDTIQREHQRHVVEERRRAERDRKERRKEVSRLRSLDSPGTPASPAPGPLVDTDSAGPDPPPPGDISPPVDPGPPAADSPAAGTPATEPTPALPSTPPEVFVPPREIGGPVPAEVVGLFFALDSTEHFDIQSLNLIPFDQLTDSLRQDPAMLPRVVQQVDALMQRVKREMDDPLAAGAFLREQVLFWFRTSGDDTGWVAKMTPRWAGLFCDSRAAGGRLAPWLNHRLWALRQRAVQSQRATARLRHRLSGTRSVEAALSRTRAQQFQSEVAQALLDDLATHPRLPDGPMPLVRLSELALRRQVPTVNGALAELFSSLEAGPFAVLHPNRYPDCDELVIRPPALTAAGAALAYTLVAAKPARRRFATGRDPVAVGDSTDGGGPSGQADGMELGTENLWELPSVPEPLWGQAIDAARQEKRRLESPPKDYRTRPAYASLRNLLLASPQARVAFLVVKWRGRPAGLPLLAALLSKGQAAPEVATDYEYLEAELGDLTQSDPKWNPEDGKWAFGEWKVVRTGTIREGLKYRAELNVAPAP